MPYRLKPLKRYLFRPIKGVWQDVLAGDSAQTFADFLTEYYINYDDRTQFVRLYDYDRRISIWIRNDILKISVEIWDIPDTK